MSIFSEESLLLIRNWDAYEDIIQAGEQLKTELYKVRNSVESRLQKEHWWKASWLLLDDDPKQITFTDRRWETPEDGYLIWVGVEGLSPEALFGNAPPPLLNVWVNGKYVELKAELQRIVQKTGKPLIGAFSKQKSYVVEMRLSKCLPDQIDLLEDALFSPLASFSEQYSQHFEEFNKAAKKYLRK